MSDKFHHTRCPECHTVFRVNDAQLDAAGGKVRCGQCKAVFYAPAWFVEPAQPEEATPDRAETSATPDTSAGETPTPPTDATPAHRRGDRYDFVAETPSDTRPFTERDLPVEDIELSDLAYPRFDQQDDSEHFDLGGAPPAAAPDPDEAADAAPEQEDALAAHGGDDPIPAADEGDLDAFLRESGVTPAAPEENPAGEPEAERAATAVDEVDEETADEEPAAGGETDEETAVEETPREEEPGEERPRAEASEDTEAQASEAPEPPGEAADAAGAEPPVLEEVPYALRESLAAAAEKPRSLGVRLALLFLVLLLTGLLAAQAIYFRGLDVAQRFPAARPLVKWVCDSLDCRYTGPRDASRIRLVNRDIRAARERDGVLVITATMVNEADFAQPYPLFEVVLSDLTGTAVAERRFRPEEYLGSLVKEQFLMQPGQPVQVTLEVLDPGSDAVNFEINFL